MDWINFLLICLVIGIVWLIITRVWISSIDIIITLLKKLFKLDRRHNTKTWHTLDEIKDKNKNN